MENCYIYIYLDQRYSGTWKFKHLIFNYRPFYIGKGSGKRLASHLHQSSLKRTSFKNSIIKAIKNDLNETPLHYKIYENLSEEDAFLIEEELINHFGRLDIKTGILANHTDGGIGANKIFYPKEKKLISQEIYQYDLDGNFLKKWNSKKEAEEDTKLNLTNLSTAIKRNGTLKNYYWSYIFLGDKIEKRIRFQMPIKYTLVEKIDINSNEILETFSTVREVIEKLNYTKRAVNKIIACALGQQGMKTYKGFKWKIYERK